LLSESEGLPDQRQAYMHGNRVMEERTDEEEEQRQHRDSTETGRDRAAGGSGRWQGRGRGTEGGDDTTLAV